MSINTVEIRAFSGPATVELAGVGVPEIVEVRQGPQGPQGIQGATGATGPQGPAGPNTVTSATTSNGTANLSLSNVTTATATVTGTLTAEHIHGNLAGSVYAHVRAGENLAKGDPVYVSGSHGSGATLIPIVSKADASDPLKMPAVGVMDAAVTNNANGHMVITGTITELDTNAFAVNAELYVAAGGGFTSTPPTTLCQPVARVERSNTNNGAVIVKVNGLSSKSAIDNTLVRRGANGDVSFATSANDTITLNLESNGDFAGITYPYAVNASAYGSGGIGAGIYSNSGWGAVIASNTNTGALISTNSGTYHADFGSGDNRSAIERVRGWFVWFYNTFTGRLKTADITANRDWTLPDASGTIALTSNIPTLGTNVATALAVNVGSAGAIVVNGGALGTPSSGTLTSCTGLPISTGVSGLAANVATFLATPSSANLAAAVTDETGTGSLVFANAPTFTGGIGFSSAAVATTSRENLGLQTLVLASDLSATTTAFVNSSESVTLAAGTYRITLTMFCTTNSTTSGVQARLLSSTTTNALTQYRTITWDQNTFDQNPMTSSTQSYTRAVASTNIFLMQRSSGGTVRKSGAVDLHGILVLDSSSTINFSVAQFNANDASFPGILRAGAMASFTRIS